MSVGSTGEYWSPGLASASILQEEISDVTRPEPVRDGRPGNEGVAAPGRYA